MKQLNEKQDGAKNERYGRSRAKFRGLGNFTASARKNCDTCDIADSQSEKSV